MGTLHANNANQALDRIINFFPDDRRQQLLMDLSLNLRAIVSLRLIPREGAEGRVPAVELLLTSPYIADLIHKGEVHEIKEQMKKSQALGMQTFDQSLCKLYERNEISQEDALRYADSKGEVQIAIRLTERYQKTDPTAAPTKGGGDRFLELTKTDRGADLL
jgi:twitching motility protein PilU